MATTSRGTTATATTQRAPCRRRRGGIALARANRAPNRGTSNGSEQTPITNAGNAGMSASNQPPVRSSRSPPSPARAGTAGTIPRRSALFGSERRAMPRRLRRTQLRRAVAVERVAERPVARARGGAGRSTPRRAARAQAAVLPERERDDRPAAGGSEDERSPAATRRVRTPPPVRRGTARSRRRSRSRRRPAGRRSPRGRLPAVERRDREVRGRAHAAVPGTPPRAGEPEPLRQERALERGPVAAARDRDRDVRG